MKRVAAFAFLVFSFLSSLHAEEIGRRPYEMDRAGRTVNPHPPLVDFESLEGWTVETANSTATFETSREQQLWGERVGRLVYRGGETEDAPVPVIVLRPPAPLPIPASFDCVDLWVYGNNWEWESDASTPRVALTLLLKGRGDEIVRVPLDTVRWKEWFLVHRKLPEAQRDALGETPKLEGLEIRGGSNTEDRVLFFDDLSFYVERLEPLSFEPRPLRGVDFPGGQGTNTGPGRLPFPDRPDTILPSSGPLRSTSTLLRPDTEADGKSYRFIYDGPEGTLAWKYEPRTGTLDDLAFSWKDTDADPPAVCRLSNAGIRFVKEPTQEERENAELLSIAAEDNQLSARWKIGDNIVDYRFRLRGKTLVVDIACPGGNVSEIVFGELRGGPLQPKRFVPVPFLTGSGVYRPEVLVAEDTQHEDVKFFLPMVDHTLSGASQLFFLNKIEDGAAIFGGGARYLPKTDGTRNDCHERLLLTLSPKFEEVLPNIPNPISPWKEATAERVWRSHGSSNHDSDFRYWSRLHRYGLRKILITDHEVMWRDGGESYTFRTSAAPGRGGDEGQREYTEKIHSLGFLYGPYNNYTDYAPVNEHWSEDWVTRHADGNYRAAWARCYNPKPAVAVQTEPKITEIVQDKFGFNTAYCDVHTSIAPWDYVDYDARVPGAGTFAATYYAYGEILLHQKRIWGGPVYSEGPNHWYYSGLTDGNYGQDQAYFVHQAGLPWLVDFDLLKIHPKENNFGMGNVDMFFGPSFWQLPDKNAALDRFLAATLAFGHTGYLAMETGLAGGIRSYFALQQLAARYGVQRVAQIRYADETGKLLTASQALASGAIEWNRVKVEYEDLYGNRLRVYVNGNPELPWTCYDNRREIAEIPPNGWFVEDSTGKVKAWSLEIDGRRTDYVESPEYLFAEIRDNLRGKPCRFDRLLCDGQLIVLKNVDEQGRWEMIVGEADYPSRSSLHAVRLDGDVNAESAVALDFERKEIGPAKTRYSRGMVHVMPVEGAFSYLVTPKEKDKTPSLFGAPGPNSSAVKVVPGQTVPVGRYDRGTFTTIPLDAKPNTLYWFREEFDKNSLDFEIIEPYKITATLDRERSRLDFTIRLPELEEASSGFVIHTNDGEGRKIHVELQRDGETVYLNVAQLKPGEEFAFALEDAFPGEPGEQILTLSVESQVYEPFFSQKSETLLFEKKYRLVTAADSLQTALREE